VSFIAVQLFSYSANSNVITLISVVLSIIVSLGTTGHRHIITKWNVQLIDYILPHTLDAPLSCFFTLLWYWWLVVIICKLWL